MKPQSLLLASLMIMSSAQAQEYQSSLAPIAPPLESLSSYETREDGVNFRMEATFLFKDGTSHKLRSYLDLDRSESDCLDRQLNEWKAAFSSEDSSAEFMRDIYQPHVVVLDLKNDEMGNPTRDASLTYGPTFNGSQINLNALVTSHGVCKLASKSDLLKSFKEAKNRYVMALTIGSAHTSLAMNGITPFETDLARHAVTSNSIDESAEYYRRAKVAKQADFESMAQLTYDLNHSPEASTAAP